MKGKTTRQAIIASTATILISFCMSASFAQAPVEEGADSRVDSGTQSIRGTGTQSIRGTGAQSGEESSTDSIRGTGTQSGEESSTDSIRGTGTQSGEQIGTDSIRGTGTQSAGGNAYTVQEGDTLSSIALEFGVTVEAIQAENNIADPNLIRVGQTLKLPAST